MNLRVLFHFAKRARKSPRFASAPTPRDHFSRGVLSGFIWCVLLLGLFAPSRVSAETIPPAPARHFNDYAGVASREGASSLDRQLAQFERDTSNQLLVAVFRKMDSESSIEDYTVRVAESWKVGKSGRNNGAVLFVFVEDRQMYIQVGYGLEPVLTDAIASQIIRNEITPRFRTGDFTGGLRAGVQAMMAATKGEYRGTGRTQAEARGTQRGRSRTPAGPVFLFVLVMIVMGIFSRRGRNNLGGGRRRRWHNNDNWPNPGGGMMGGFGGFGGGGSGSSGGGGGFSGGGGSFGGGGAGGRW